MSERAERLFEEAQALEPEERAVLALMLLDSVGEPQPEIERAWSEEVRRRVEEIDDGRVKLSDWAEARSRIFSRT
jgi:putative addiction module component (TIGR02574 family)